MASTRRNAFTLIELLVVISIVAILAGMLLPALGQVKLAAQQMRCASSQRQVAMAIQAYPGDWDGLLPRLKTPRVEDSTLSIMWFSAVAIYLGYDDDSTATLFAQRSSSAIWGCPAWRPTGAALSTSRPGYGMTWYFDAPTSWITNMCWLDPGGGLNNYGVDVPLSRIRKPSQRIQVGDSLDWHLFFTAGSPGYHAGVWDPERHRGKAVYTFFDGHVQAISAKANAYLGCSDPGSAAWIP